MIRLSGVFPGHEQRKIHIYIECILCVSLWHASVTIRPCTNSPSPTSAILYDRNYYDPNCFPTVELVLQPLGCMDIHLGQAEDAVLMYCLQKHLGIGPRGYQMGTGHWRLCRPQCPPIHWWSVLRWGQLEGLPLALPDGHECVATGGPQVVFILFIALLPLPGSSGELGVLKLMTLVTVKQATMELEHCGSVRVIALHG